MSDLAGQAALDAVCHYAAGVVSQSSPYEPDGSDLWRTFRRDTSVHKEILGPVNEQRREMVGLCRVERELTLSSLSSSLLRSRTRYYT